MQPSDQARRRLHPLSPVLRGSRFVALVVLAISWQGLANLGIRRWAIAVGAIAVVILVWSVLSYLVTGYQVLGRELRIAEGLLVRRNRSIPLERLQSVELVQPLLPRLFGLAELRLEVVGGGRAEAPLAYLTLDQATALRQRLLHLSTGRPAPIADAPPGQTVRADLPAVTTAAAPSEQVVHVVDNGRLLGCQLLRPQWWLLPLGVTATILDTLTDSHLGFIGLASMVTGVIGAVSAPVRVLLADWGFTLATAGDGLRIRRGLLERRSSTVPEGRIQSVVVEWPLLWRPFGWVRANMHVAGVRVEREQARAGLLPVASVPEAETVIGHALPGVVLREIAIRPVPDRAKWLDPLQRHVIGYQLGPAAFASRHGLLTRRLVIVPYARIQSVRVHQGPLQRMLRLASVFVDVAGVGASGLAQHLDVAEARAIALELAERSRAARRAPLPA
ncbi:MAG TPA: PH domain-containing protein [Micromonosporaceae bacterium]|jgi:putative membrane protein